jgi:DNA-binding transcriptional ArsR family regulator
VSVTLMGQVWKMSLGPTDKLVLLSLADWSNDDGYCWPSMSQLASKTGLTDRSIRASVGRLRDAGHLTRDERKGKGVLYRVHPGTSFPPEAASPRKETTKTPEGRSANTSVNTILSEVANAPSEKARPKVKPSRRAPEAWEPTPETIQALTADGYEPGELERALSMVRDHEFRTPRSDWDAAYRNWVRRDPPARARHDRPDHHKRPSPRDDRLERMLAGAQRAVGP